MELEVSGVDAARIDQVLARPEFAGWTRHEWCVEILRTALRYYMGDAPAGNRGRDAAGPPSGRQRAAPPPSAQADVARQAQREQAQHEQTQREQTQHEQAQHEQAQHEQARHEQTRQECVHPAGARDYETGTCAACGAILWD